MRERVVRVLIYEGETEWIDRTLEASYVSGTNNPFFAGNSGRITAQVTERTVKAYKEAADDVQTT